MAKLRAKFGDPEHGWIEFSISDGAEQVVQCVASYIFPSLEELVIVLLRLLDAKEERLVVWAEEPDEIELRFSRQSETDAIRLEITHFDGGQRPRERIEPNFTFEGTYEQICLPFWRALRELQGRYSVEALNSLWQAHFPHRELALLTERLGKQ